MNAALARSLYFASQGLRGEPVGRILRELEDSERWSPDRLAALQWQRIRSLVRHAFQTVPFYRARWSAIGFEPAELRTPADWERLPMLEKAEVQEHGPALTSSRAPAGHAGSTSGSSGTPVTVLRSHLSWAHGHANLFRHWRWHGIQVGERYAYFWGLALDREGRRQAALKDLLFNRDRCSAFELDADGVREHYRRLIARPARFAFGYTSALTRFADEIAAQSLDGRALGWKAVITSAEVLRPHQRQRIGETFGCPVAEHYGCAEAGLASYDCERGRMHVPVESVVVDLVPTPGGLQEVLITDLHNYSQPMIRYRLGDLVEPRLDPCSCGRGLPVFGAVHGRAGDTITLPDGRRIHAILPYYVFRHHGTNDKVREYQFVQFRSGRIELRITPGPAWSDRVRHELEAGVLQALGVKAEIRLVERFERRGRGKHRDFVRAEEIGEVGSGTQE